MIDPNLGQYGGEVLRVVRTAGQVFTSGQQLPPELVLSWPIRNRIALKNTGQVRYFDAPFRAKKASAEVKPPEAETAADADLGREEPVASEPVSRSRKRRKKGS